MRARIPVLILLAVGNSLAVTRAAIPPTFERNIGQAAPSVEWVVRSGAGAPMYLRATGAAIAQPSKDGVRTVEMRFEGGRATVESAGEEPLASYSNYYRGRDRKSWYTGVPHFGRVRYSNVYPGIDVVYHIADGGNVEYDFEVKPGADPSRIHIRFRHIDGMRIGGNGDLILTTGGSELRQRRPLVLQRGVQIRGGYRIHQGSLVELALAGYDRTSPLLIDPVIQLASYLGGPGAEQECAIRVDSRGFLYIAGSSQSTVSPTLDPFEQSGLTSSSPYIFKLSPDATRVVFYLTLQVDNKTVPDGFAIDGDGNLLLVGETAALQLPLVNPIGSQFNANGQTVFATKWAADGRSMIYSTYFGGTGNEHAKAGAVVDSDGNLYFAGATSSMDLPVQDALQPVFGGGTASLPLNGSILFNPGQPLDCYVAKISPQGRLLFSTYLGGSGDDVCAGMAWSPDGSLVIVGQSNSSDFPTVNAIQSGMSSLASPVIAKLQPDGQALVFSTFFGGSITASATAVAVDSSGNIYFGGHAGSGLPPKNAFQPTATGGGAYVAAIDPSGANILYTTYLDGTASGTMISQVVAGPDGSAYIAGTTMSADFPLKNSLRDFKGDPNKLRGNFFLTRLAPSGSELVFSTYLGGNGTDLYPNIDLEADGTIYFAGSTDATDLPTENALQATPGGGRDIVFLQMRDDSVVDTPPFTLSAGVLFFRAVQGSTLPAPQTIKVHGAAFTASADSPWLKATPSDSDATALAITVAPTGLDPGLYRGAVSLQDDAGGSSSIQILFNVLGPPPRVTSVTPKTIPAGSPATELTFKGTNFAPNATVLLGGAGGFPFTSSPVTVDGPETLRITLPESFLKAPTTILFAVQNPQSAASGLVFVQVQ